MAPVPAVDGSRVVWLVVTGAALVAPGAFWSGRETGGWSRVTFGDSAAGLLIVSVAAAAGGYLAGRWGEAVGAPRRVDEGSAERSRTDPPDGLGPTQTAFLAEAAGATGWRGLVGTLMRLDQQGLIRTTPGPARGWLFEGTANPTAWAAADDVTREVASALGVDQDGGQLVVVGPTCPRQLWAASEAHRQAVYEWAYRAGVVASDLRGLWARYGWLAALTACALWSILAVTFGPAWIGPAVWALPAAAFVVQGAPTMRPHRLAYQFTVLADELRSQATAYRRHLDEHPPGRGASPEIRQRDMCYAMALGLGDPWLDRAEPAGTSPGMVEPESPDPAIAWARLVRDLIVDYLRELNHVKFGR